MRRSWRQSAEAVMSRNYSLWNVYRVLESRVRVLESRVNCIGLQLCFHRANWHSPAATLNEVFPRFFLSCKANARVYLAKTGHGPHSS